MKLLITGGAGFIGANFVDWWLTRHAGDNVVVLDKMTDCANPRTVTEHQEKWGDRYRMEKGCITDAVICDRLVAECDMVVHFAAESHVDNSIERPTAFTNTNVLGTQTLLESLRKSPKTRFHHISTDEVFGTLGLDDKELFHESRAFAPRSPYAASKAASDHIALAYHITYDLPITVSWCSNNYGAYQFPEKLIPLLITRLTAGLEVPIYGDGRYVREWLWVEDHCAAIEKILLHGTIGEGYCIGGAPERNVLQVAEAVCEALGADKSLLVHTIDRAAHDRRYAMHADKMTNEMDWKVTGSFEVGIQHTVEWYLNNKEWWADIAADAHKMAEKYLKNRA